MTARFGRWELDHERHELLRDGRPVALTEKAYRLLELLLEERPRLVTKSRIHDRLWPTTFVAEVNLSRLVFELRSALGDDARRPRWIRTVRGLGYAFRDEPAAAASEDPPRRAACRLLLAGREVSLGEGETVLGRGEEAAVCLYSRAVSRRHARLFVRGVAVTVEDLGSCNGTFVNGAPVTGPTPIGDRDRLRLGDETIAVRIVRLDGSTERAEAWEDAPGAGV